MKKTFFIFLSIFLFSLIYEAKANICDLPLNLRKPEKIKILRLIESIMPVEPVNLIMKPTEPSKPTRLIYYRLHPINFCMTGRIDYDDNYTGNNYTLSYYDYNKYIQDLFIDKMHI